MDVVSLAFTSPTLGRLDLRLELRGDRLLTEITTPAGRPHAIANAGAEPVLALMWSSAREPSVSVYPDSDKIGVWAGEDHVLLRRSDGHVDYYDGEADPR